MKLQLVIVALHDEHIADVKIHANKEDARQDYYAKLREQLRRHSWFRIRDILDADENQLDLMLNEFGKTTYPLIVWVEAEYSNPYEGDLKEVIPMLESIADNDLTPGRLDDVIQMIRAFLQERNPNGRYE